LDLEKGQRKKGIEKLERRPFNEEGCREGGKGLVEGKSKRIGFLRKKRSIECGHMQEKKMKGGEEIHHLLH